MTMIPPVRSGRIAWLAGALGVATALAPGCGCPAAKADSASEAWALLSSAPRDFDQLFGAATPTIGASPAGVATNPLDTLLSDFSAWINGVSPEPSMPG